MCHEMNISFLFQDISLYQAERVKKLSVSSVLSLKVLSKTLCVIDLDCALANKTLQKFSDYRFFNTTYSWLLLSDSHPSDLDSILWSLKHIQMNSDVTYLRAVDQDNRTHYELMDVYSKGRHICKDIFQTGYGYWSEDEGLLLVSNYNSYYERKNFEGMKLRGTTVIDRDNVTSDDVDRILSEPGNVPGIVVFVKYHYSLMCILRDFHNFKINYRVARGWAGRLRSGYRLGLLGILSRNEADVAATGIFQRINRHAEFDIIHQSWEFTSGFIYRITPQLSSAVGGGNFFTPFDDNVWIASLVTMALILFSITLVTFFVSKYLCSERNSSIMSHFLEIVATTAQQGLSEDVSPSICIRIILVSLLLFNLVLYNYYTSSVVGGLLSSPGKGPETIQEIIDSPLVVSFRDIGYHKILFRETTDPLIRELYQKKVQPSREGQDLVDVYTDVETVVPYLKRGGFTFHCEMTEAFQEIANQFDANEVCELRTANGLLHDLKLTSFVLPKRSMYTEMFKITMMRAQEIGLVKRNLKIHRIEKPICQSGSRVNPVEISGVTMAFELLGGGFVLAVFLMLVEILYWKSILKKSLLVFST
ncbi:ionotropic receptor 75a [Uranotaenia lowii]|uniref:ionotropic receptor 75a n=1 Tax=Uranotaenia lowii TaxID=190385 RepID=UPI00247852AD|nr:ionotropic receptor 75a [Uranotaenia lowii]